MHPRRPLLLLLLLLLLVPVLLAGRSRPGVSTGAACTTIDHADAIADRLAAGRACNDDRLALGAAASCTTPVVPLCARGVVDETLALSYGQSELPEVAAADLTAGLTCQAAIGAWAEAYAAERLRRLVQGDTPDDADASAFAAAPAFAPACAANVAQSSSGVVLPQVGAQCAAAVGEPGDPVDTDSLEDCMRTLLGVFVDRVSPVRGPLRPNIILVVTDDQRFDAIGDTHGPAPGEVAMPTVHALAQQGLTFSTAYVNWPSCESSRATMLTGQYASRSGFRDFPTFAEGMTIGPWMSHRGYRTAYVGKYLFGYSSFIKNRYFYVPTGWTKWAVLRHQNYYGYDLVDGWSLVPYGDGPDDYSTDVLRDHAVSFIEDSADQGPFFMIYAPLAPHNPPTPADRHAGDFAERASFRPPAFDEEDVDDKPRVVSRNPRWSEDHKQREDDRQKGQLESLRAVDEAVAAMLSAVEAAGVADDTVVIYTSDNGQLWGEHRLTGKKWAYEESTRVPFIVHYPRLVPLPRTETRAIANVDLVPTLLQLAGASASRPLDGDSLVPLFDGTATDWRDAVFLEGERHEFQWWGVRQGDWKYVVYNFGQRELYDLANDPHELENLVAHPDQKDRANDLGNLVRTEFPEAPRPPQIVGTCGLGAEIAPVLVALGIARRRVAQSRRMNRARRSA